MLGRGAVRTITDVLAVAADGSTQVGPTRSEQVVWAQTNIQRTDRQA